MAITTVPPYAFPNPTMISDIGASNTPSFDLPTRMNASGDKMAFVLRVPKTGTLNKFICVLASVADNPDNGIRLSFQDVDAATGNPDGTQDQYRDITGTITAGAQIPGVMTNDGTNGGTKRSVTVGDFVCCVIDFVSFTGSDSITVSYHATVDFSGASVRDAYMANAPSGSYNKLAYAIPQIALEYDDGSYALFDNGVSVGIVETATFASNSTPDERALRFKIPYGCRVIGAMAVLDVDAALDVVLYDASNNVLGSFSIDANNRAGTSAGWSIGYWTGGPVTLTADTEYRVSIKPTTTTSVGLQGRVFPSSAYLASNTMGAEWYLSTRTDAGAWSADQTRVPLISLFINGIEFTVTGGGGATARTFVF